ncbi:MAG: T9SS type A sorting domain-containing protein [Lewinellaceae bacterium]|nr:T9SS type A sorting domain-containing protein [Lewinellaceae bacterium]
MKRKEFLQGIGLAGIGTLISKGPMNAEILKEGGPLPPNCTLIPTETAGPFPLDLSENTTFFRQDVREDRTGIQLNVKLRIIGANNCEPMPNARVNIWHCDKDGLYSGYSQQNNQGQAGLTYLRGYQMTDANGEVEFTTIFPGWYTGRICHIHFQVYVSSVYAAISQLTFPIETKNALYADNAALYTKGADPLNYTQDNIFSDGYAYQLATLTQNAETGGYDTFLEVTVQGSGVTGLANLEPETGGQFKLGQNFPNPYNTQTTVPFNLTNKSDVQLEIWDLSGKRLAALSETDLPPGDHRIEVDLKSLGLQTATYVYQLQVSNQYGAFRQCKVMTAQGN